MSRVFMLLDFLQKFLSGAFYSTDYVWGKKSCHYENVIIFLLNNTYSLSTGPTVLISYITVTFYKTKSYKSLLFYCFTGVSFIVKTSTSLSSM